MKILVLALASAVSGLALILWAQGSAPANCGYQPDQDPRQLGPGRRDDGDYSFRYVSDYEADTQIYRRRICNNSKQKVLFDWPSVALKGRCPAQGVLSEETPHPGNPSTGEAPLHYDYRQAQTTAYLYKPQASQVAPPKKLISVISGYVQNRADLLPIKISLIAAYEDNRFVYTVANDSRNPAKVYWKEFSDFWRERQREQYVLTFRQLSENKMIAGDPSAQTFVLNPGAKAVWVFQLPGIPVLISSTLEIYGLDAKEGDLIGVAPLFLPRQ
jgi:hypothetical protein